MSGSLIVLILIALTAVGLAFVRDDRLRNETPTAGGIFGDTPNYDADLRRVEHDLDAIRTRFERNPVWPASGVLGERR